MSKYKIINNSLYILLQTNVYRSNGHEWFRGNIGNTADLEIHDLNFK